MISAFKSDARVLFWEIFNEPNSSQFSLDLRAAGYKWALAVNPTQPIISCWDNNEFTQIVDVHRYSSDFADWTKDVYSDVSKGAVITEAGSRWYQGYDSDSGSVLLVVTYLEVLRTAS